MLPLTSAVSVTAGTKYWLTAICDTTGMIRWDTDVFQFIAWKDQPYGDSFPLVFSCDISGYGGHHYLQGWGAEAQEGSGLYIMKYNISGGWLEEEKLEEPPDLNIFGGSWTSDYLAVSGKASVIWTQGASSPYNVRHLLYDFGEATWAITGYLWVEEDNLCYSDTDELKRFWLGTKAGATGQAPGYLWVEGVNLRYIGSSGDERYIAGVKEGATGQTTGQLWLESDNKLHYIDSSGDERTILGTLAV